MILFCSRSKKRLQACFKFSAPPGVKIFIPVMGSGIEYIGGGGPNNWNVCLIPEMRLGATTMQSTQNVAASNWWPPLYHSYGKR